MELAAIQEKLDDLAAKADQAVAAAQGDHAKLEEAKALLDSWAPEIAELKAEKAEAIRQEEMKALTGELTTLKDAIEQLRAPAPRFIYGPEGTPGDNDSDPYQYILEEGKALETGGRKGLTRPRGHKINFWQDVRMANKGSDEARKRLSAGVELPEGWKQNEEGKAYMTLAESVNAEGGFLVRPQIERQLVLARESDNVLRQLCSSINVVSNSISLDQLGLTTTALWTAEEAAKDSVINFTLANITANVFTAAALVAVSNQLLADSDPSIDQLILDDFAKRLVALEETAFLNGSGTGEPRGILNTAGLGATTVASGGVSAVVNGVLDAIASVESSHGAPSAILMHPRTWTAILKANATSGAWLLGAPSQANNSPVTDARTVIRGPEKVLWGYPVITTNRMPTNLGGGTESRIIVGDFREALILDRQGITVDVSEHFLFSTNQTMLRSEMRVGFTAARTPAAFNIVGGAALAGI